MESQNYSSGGRDKTCQLFSEKECQNFDQGENYRMFLQAESQNYDSLGQDTDCQMCLENCDSLSQDTKCLTSSKKRFKICAHLAVDSECHMCTEKRFQNFVHLAEDSECHMCTEKRFQNFVHLAEDTKCHTCSEKRFQDGCHTSRSDINLSGKHSYDNKSQEDGTMSGSVITRRGDAGALGDSCTHDQPWTLLEISDGDVSRPHRSPPDMSLHESNKEGSEKKSEGKELDKKLRKLRWTFNHFFWREFVKEFSWNRFYLNHFEFIDFTIFEYGRRGQYLVWRVVSLLTILLLSIYVVVPGVQVAPGATPVSGYMFMHCWLHMLLALSTTFEVSALIWSFYRTPCYVLAKIHYTPWHFKLIWASYNILYPNLMSCNFMHYLILTSLEEFTGDLAICSAILATFISINVTVTAMPSRLVHFVQPLAFNVFYLLVIVYYQKAGFTDPAGRNYVYQEMDWGLDWVYAFSNTLTWLSLTFVCYIGMVSCCWCRRTIYRYTRAVEWRCLYGISEHEYFLFKGDFDTPPDVYFETKSKDILCCS